MAKYKVIAEFIDKETGERVKPGTMLEVSGKRVERLKRAGVIEEGEQSEPQSSGSAGKRAGKSRRSKTASES